MPTITLNFKDKKLKEYRIDVGQTITIGRHKSNDIVIDNLAVSGMHARIDSVSATFILTDLESTNGTFVNKKLISSHGLKNNDAILIGKHTLLFDRSDIEKTPDASNDNDLDDTKTRYLDTAEYQDMIKQTTKQQKPPQVDNPDDSEKTKSESEGLVSSLFKKIFR